MIHSKSLLQVVKDSVDKAFEFVMNGKLLLRMVKGLIKQGGLNYLNIKKMEN